MKKQHNLQGLYGKNLKDILRFRAEYYADNQAYIFLRDGEEEHSSLNNSVLDLKARSIAGRLSALGALSGDRVLLLYPPGLDFIAAFFGCLYAGVIAVPVYPPQPARLERTLPKLMGIIGDAEPRFVLTSEKIKKAIGFISDDYPVLSDLIWVAEGDIQPEDADFWCEPVISWDDIAFLQYTSGSTGRPKGVMVSHGNLIHNQQLMQYAFKTDEHTVVVGWLPLYHDMGLIGNVLHPMFQGVLCVLMSPAAFLQSPIRWLEAIHRYRATVSGGPDFAYNLCVNKIPAAKLQHLDLSCWQSAFNGSEPVRSATMERFADHFKPCGFRYQAFLPCYGMAETTLIVSGGNSTGSPLSITVDERAISKGRVVHVSPDHEAAYKLAASGSQLPEMEAAIVQPETGERCAEDEIGEIWVAGPSIAAGYWRQPELTKSIFQVKPSSAKHHSEETPQQWMRTGDFGFIYQGELIVTGRLKDVIIIRGRNYYPHDIELSVERCDSRIVPYSAAAFSVEVDGVERLAIAVEVERRLEKQRRQADKAVREQKIFSDRRWLQRRQHTILPEHKPDSEPFQLSLTYQQIINSIRSAVSSSHDLQVYAVLLLKTGTTPKTTSGKIQRHACRNGFKDGSLDVLFQYTGPLTTPSLLPFTLTPVHRHTNALKQWLKTLIARLFGVDQDFITLEHSLYDFGLDSLSAVELQHQLGGALGVTLPLSRLLKGPSLEQLIQDIISAAENFSATVQAGWTSLNTISGEFPLSYNQRSLWFMYRLAPTSCAYHVCFPVRITNQLNMDALKLVWQIMAERHSSLRTTYTEHDGVPVQIVHDKLSIPIEETYAVTGTESQLYEALHQEILKPFDLETEPPLRIRVLKRSEDTVLMLVFHHIAIDLWSLSVLLEEFDVLYPVQQAHIADGAINPLTAGLHKIVFNYPDFVFWQHGMLGGRDGEYLENYWKNCLGHEVPFLDLPKDYPRPAVQTFDGSSFSFELERSLTMGIKALSRKANTTVYVTLMTAFVTLLSRYAGQTDIWVGTPAAGRTCPESRDIVGYLANPVVIRADLSDSPSFYDLLLRVRDKVQEALNAQDYPLAKLVELLQPQRDAAVSPLFQAMFVLEKTHRMPIAAPFVLRKAGAVMELGGLQLESLPLPLLNTQFDLTMMMVESDDKLCGALEYNTDLFRLDTIERMTGHFINILVQAVTLPETPVTDINLMSDTERRDILKNFSTGPHANGLSQPFYLEGDSGCRFIGDDLTQWRSIVDLIQSSTELFPDEPAVIYGNESLTYRRLNELVNRTTAFLLNQCRVKPGQKIGSLLQRSSWVVVSMLGILKAGAVYTPIDPAYPAERIRYMLQDSGISLILSEPCVQTCLSDLPSMPAIEDITAISDNHLDFTRHPITPEQAAYLLYTSGSTGIPKGVIQTHRTLSNLIQWQTEQIRHRLRILQYAALGFDVSLQETLYSLASGGTLFVIPDNLRYDMIGLADYIISNQIELITMPCTPLTMLFREAPHLAANSSLKHIITSGEALRIVPELAEYLRHHPQVCLHNQYGPTETHVVTAHTIAAVHDNIVSHPHIGRPIHNTWVYILDSRLQPVPIGVKGEIYLQGANLAHGYLNRSDMTRQKFIANPFNPFMLMYRTGDVGRWLPDGNIEFLGRYDDQVKIHGQRVEPAEIEIQLSQLPEVKEAVVVAGRFRQDQQLELAAYIVPHSDFNVEIMRQKLQPVLPHYMIPTYCVTVPRFVMSANGKINKNALPPPTLGAAAESIPPTTPTESILADIWQEVLDISQVGIRDNFFELGGHSLKAIQIISRVHQRFQVKLTLQDIFIRQNIAELALIIDNADKDNTIQPIEPIQPIELIEPA